MKVAGRSWGLRARLLLAFVLLGAITAAAVSAGMYIQARDVILRKAQDAAVLAVTDEATRLFPIGSLPPSDSTLNSIAGALSHRDNMVVAVYGARRSGAVDPDTFPQKLRQAVGTGSVAWQRVLWRGEPTLIIGTQLVVPQPGPDQVEVYVLHSLLPEQDSIDKLARTAGFIGGASLVLATLLALVAARGVLRPVRELQRAAERQGEGDLSARLKVRGADELAGVARTFNNTAEALQRHVSDLRRMEADARRFVADVSHELRTPLAAMAAVADVLDEEAAQLPGDAGQAARLVSQETHNLTRLVNDLMEVSRFDSGAAALALDEVDVAAAVNATLRARGWSDQVETWMPRGILASLEPRRLDVVIANLVGNALRHGAPPVVVRLRADQHWITVEVIDHGPGLNPQVLPHVFDRFYKADTARSRSEGSGLGLAIAWENARLHRGSLVAANRAEGGAVFTLYLPRQTSGGSL